MSESKFCWLEMGTARSWCVLLLAATCVTTPRDVGAAYVQDAFYVGGWGDPADQVPTLRRASGGGFNLTTGTETTGNGAMWASNFGYCSTAEIQEKLDRAQLSSMFAMVTDLHFFGKKGSAPTSPTFDSTIASAVLSGYSSTNLSINQDYAMFGFNLFDEPEHNTGHIGWVKSWSKAIHQDNASHEYVRPRAAFVTLDPGCSGGLSCFPARVSELASDSDPQKELDIISMNLYPFFENSSGTVLYAPFYFAYLKVLRDSLADRAFWVTSKLSEHVVGANGYGERASRPDAAQLRFMAFAPAAAGAKGIIWFTYAALDAATSMCTSTNCPDNFEAVVDMKGMPTCKYHVLKSINHYLHAVVGPAAINDQHIGIHHAGAYLADATDVPSSEYVTNPANRAASPVDSLGHAALAVGVFRVPGTDDYDLLVLNKSLSPIGPSSVYLDSIYSIAAAPSVVGFKGGSGFSPVGSATAFSVTLAGGEARLYRVSPAPIAGPVLVSQPSGGATWVAGQSHTVEWEPDTQSVAIALLPDPLAGSGDITGAKVNLTSSASGGAFNFTIPDVWSNRARIQLTPINSEGFGPVLNSQDVRTAPAPVENRAEWGLGSAGCYTHLSLALLANGAPAVAYRGYRGRLQFASFDEGEGAWSDEVLASPGQFNSAGDTARTRSTRVASHLPSVIVDRAGRTHIAHQGYLSSGSGGLHLLRTGSSWTQETAYNGREFESGAILVALPDSGVASISAEGGELTAFIIRWSAAGWQDPDSAVYIDGVTNCRHFSAAADEAGNVYVTFAAGSYESPVLKVLKVPISGSPVELLSSSMDIRATATTVNSAGAPIIAYSRRMGTGSDRIDAREFSGSSFGAAVAVDQTAGSVSGLSLVFSDSLPRVAYTRNGVLVRAKRTTSGTWNRDVMSGAADAEGPVSMAITSSGVDWIAFFDRATDRVRVVRYPAPSTGDGGCPGGPNCEPGEILPSIRTISGNPLVGRDGALLFELTSRRSGNLSIELFDVAGRIVSRRPQERVAAGTRRVEWSPGPVRAGVYFVRARFDQQDLGTSRVVLVR